MDNDLLPYSVKPPAGHKTSGAPYMMFVLYCECGWRTVPNPEWAGAYRDWRRHALEHGGVRETYEAHQKREAAYRRKLRGKGTTDRPGSAADPTTAHP